MISYQVHRFGARLARVVQETPRPDGSQVLLRVQAAGVCHTDIHTWQGWYDMGGGKRLTMGDRGVGLPLTLGHEVAGQVAAVGPQAAGAAVGRRCLVYPWIGCGECKICRRGAEQLCPAPRFLGIFRAGGYSDHVLVPHPRYLIDIGDMPAAQAAPYACSGLTAYSALRKFDPAVLREERVVIFGAGGLGLMAATLLPALDGAGAVVVEPDAARREAALAAGACEAIDPAAPDFMARVRSAAGGSVWAVLDCVGSAQTVQSALDLLTKGGQFVQIGLFGGQIALPTPLLPIRALSYHGSYVGSLEELHALMALVRDRALPPVPTTCRCLAEADAALDDLEHGRVVGRVILQPERPRPEG
ncbi:NAD-dependent alcohol dehydrogenase [Alicycliphilus denitrificans]|uniref:alcohol dehydrogenase n=1 Tax=Alicycliphilus denitrificans TaxID=179636 RepID=UPI00095C6B00|nr:alcohol dehydrogenase [Alicycliphilus denitrificans]MBN9573121.1 alcohol dehydrogenase catalytic domain-containing protein [Alicycliphilus denitrificans]OJW93243.1 MAG: alcohol dehydrogenase [Alicycliphilus sp. 69-12]BCN36909.1 NAD-dependent alcohol dehydrogenase [Alicycliphilus denitrificans]